MGSRILFILFSLLIFIACSEQDAIEEPDIVITDDYFDNILVVGDSRMAGVQDGALSMEGQQTNYVPLFMDYIETGLLDTITFTSPDIVSDKGMLTEEIFSDESGKGKINLVYTRKGNSLRSFDRNPALPELRIADGEELMNSSYEFLELNNFSFPGLSSASFFDEEISQDPYLKAMNFNSIGLLEAINEKQPTLLVLNIGEEEILDLALNGGIMNDQADNMLAQFEENIGRIFSDLESLSCPIIISSIPDVTNFPFFTQAHYNVYINAAETGTLGHNYSDFNIAVSWWNYYYPDAKRKIVDYDVFSQLTNGWLIEDDNLPDAYYPNAEEPYYPSDEELVKIRQMLNGEGIFFNLYSKLDPLGYGTLQAIEDEYSLTSQEISEIKQLIRSYNNVIYRLENIYDNVYVFDLFQTYEDILKSVEVDEGLFRGAYYVDNSLLIGGIFSADGLTFNPRGNAILANELIDFLNVSLNQQLPELDVSNFRGNFFDTSYE